MKKIILILLLSSCTFADYDYFSGVANSIFDEQIQNREERIAEYEAEIAAIDAQLAEETSAQLTETVLPIEAVDICVTGVGCEKT